MKKARPVRRLPRGQFYWAADRSAAAQQRVCASTYIYKIRETGHPIDSQHAETGNYFHSRTEAAASLTSHRHEHDKRTDSPRKRP